MISVVGVISGVKVGGNHSTVGDRVGVILNVSVGGIVSGGERQALRMREINTNQNLFIFSAQDNL
jgi:hypothetical protein